MVKKKYMQLKVSTPMGIAGFTALLAPARYKGTGPPTFHANLIVDDEVLTEWLKKIEFDKFTSSEMERNDIDSSSPLSLPYGPAKDKDKNLIPGKSEIRTKLLETTSKGIVRQPILVGADTKPLDPVPNVGSGSKLIIGVEGYGTEGGSEDKFFMCFTLRVVQVIELVEWGTVSTDTFSMAAVEGYTTPDSGDSEEDF